MSFYSVYFYFIKDAIPLNKPCNLNLILGRTLWTLYLCYGYGDLIAGISGACRSLQQFLKVDSSSATSSTITLFILLIYTFGCMKVKVLQLYFSTCMNQIFFGPSSERQWGCAEPRRKSRKNRKKIAKKTKLAFSINYTCAMEGLHSEPLKHAYVVLMRLWRCQWLQRTLGIGFCRLPRNFKCHKDMGFFGNYWYSRSIGHVFYAVFVIF